MHSETERHTTAATNGLKPALRTQRPESPLRPERLSILGVLALALIAFLLRLYHIDYRGLWFDEFQTLDTVSLPLIEMIKERWTNGHFPTYFLLIKALVSVGGQSETALRLPSALIGTASVPLLFLLAQRLWGRECAWWAALFFVLHERAIWASQEARPYAFVIFAAIGSLYALVMALEDWRRRSWLLYSLFSLFGLLTHATYLFVFITQTLVVGIWAVRTRTRRDDWLGSAIRLTLFTIVAYALLKRGHTTEDGFFNEPQWPELASVCHGLFSVFWGDWDVLTGGRLAIQIAGGLLLAFVLLQAWWMNRKAQPGLPQFSLVLWQSLAAWLGLSLACGLMSKTPMWVRYYSSGASTSAVLIALGVLGVRNRSARMVLGISCAVLLSILSYFRLNDKGHGVREGIACIAENRREDEPVFFCRKTNHTLMSRYYGLGEKPIAVVHQIREKDELRKILDKHARGRNGLWAFIYLEGNSPFAELVEEWSKERNWKVTWRDFGETKVMHSQN